MATKQPTKIFSHFASVRSALSSVSKREIDKAISSIYQARADGSNVWIVGNGGSAATASHFANDLTKMAKVRAISVPDMIPLMTAYGNDEGWNRMFSDVIRSLGRRSDLLVAISCSGNSPNVVHAAVEATNPVVITGNNPACDLSKTNPGAFIMVDNDDITVQEDVHLILCHAIAKALK